MGNFVENRGEKERRPAKKSYRRAGERVGGVRKAKSHTSARNGIRSRRAERHILEMCRLCCSERLTAFQASWKYYETVPADDRYRHLPPQIPFHVFVSNLTQKSPGFAAAKIIFKYTPTVLTDREQYCGDSAQFHPLILTRYGKTSCSLGGGDKFPRSFRSRIAEKAI